MSKNLDGFVAVPAATLHDMGNRFIIALLEENRVLAIEAERLLNEKSAKNAAEFAKSWWRFIPWVKPATETPEKIAQIVSNPRRARWQILGGEVFEHLGSKEAREVLDDMAWNAEAMNKIRPFTRNARLAAQHNDEVSADERVETFFVPGDILTMLNSVLHKT